MASLVGFVAGIGLAALLKSGLAALGIDIPAGGVVVLPRTLIVSLIVGVAITVISAVIAGRAGARATPPVAAMRDVALDTSGTLDGRRLIWGVALVVVGAVARRPSASPARSSPSGSASRLIFIGVFVLGPLIARPFAGVIGAPLPRLKGISGRLAKENAMRNPKRTSRTAAALMVGVAFVAGISVLAASIKSSVHDIFNKQFTGDFVVNTNTQGFGGLPLTVAHQLNQLPEVDAAAGVGIGAAKVDNGAESLSVIDPPWPVGCSTSSSSADPSMT